MRYFLLIAILLFGVTGFAQNKTANVKKGNTYVDFSFTAADTINEGETYYVEITNFQDYPAMQDIYLAGNAVTGSGDIVITAYGKKFSDDSYSSIGATTWNSTLSLDEVITVSTANRYRYYKVAFVSDGTNKQVLLTDIIFKNWFTGGEFSTTSLNLSGTLTVAGESTFNDHVNLGAGDDLLGSTTSDINMGSGNFTVAGATGDVGVGNDLSVTNDVLLLNGAVVGITGNEVITFNAAGSINFTGATVDVDGAFTASTVGSDGAVTATSGVNLGTSQALVGTTAMTIGSGTQTVNINSSDWNIDATGIMTGIGTIASGKVSSTGGVDLGTSQALTGTTAITIGSGGVTTAITSSDWAIDATGIATGFGDITSNGLITSDKLRFENATSTDVSALPAYFSETLSGLFGDGGVGYGMTVYSKILGADLAATDAYESAITGLYGITGTNASVYPKTAVLGWIMDNTTTADAAFVALIDGDTQITQAGAAYAVRYLNSTPTSEFGYGLDLFSAAIGGYNAVTYATADIRFQNGEILNNELDKNLISNGNFIVQTPTPDTVNFTRTITAANMLSGVITSTSAAAVSMTTPTATAIMALIPNGGQGTTFDLIIDNSAGSSTITLVLDGSISVNTPAITGGDTLTVSTANTVACFRFYFVSGTAAKVFRIY